MSVGIVYHFVHPNVKNAVAMKITTNFKTNLNQFMKTKLGIPDGLTYQYAKPLDYLMLVIAILGLFVSIVSFVQYTIPNLVVEESTKEPDLIDLSFYLFIVVFAYDVIWSIKYIQYCIPNK